MRVQLESTSKIVMLSVEGKDIPARIWEGVTENGVPCHAYITRIACAAELDTQEFERDLQEHRAPSAESEWIPARLIL